MLPQLSAAVSLQLKSYKKLKGYTSAFIYSYIMFKSLPYLMRVMWSFSVWSASLFRLYLFPGWLGWSFSTEISELTNIYIYLLAKGRKKSQTLILSIRSCKWWLVWLKEKRIHGNISFFFKTWILNLVTHFSLFATWKSLAPRLILEEFKCPASGK